MSGGTRLDFQGIERKQLPNQNKDEKKMLAIPGMLFKFLTKLF